MRILLKVPLSPYSGYGNDGIGIVRALIKAGVDVYLDPTVVQAPVPPEVAHILTKEVRAPFDMILSHVDPMQLAATDAMRDSSDFVVGWTMWEYSNMRNMSKRTTARKRWRNFDAMVAYDPVTADGLKEFYRGDILVQQGGYHPEDWQPLERDWADPRFYFCQIGVLSDRKNPFLSIQAYSELQQEHDDFREFARLSLKTTVPGLHSKMEDVYPGLRIFYDSWPQSVVRQYYASNHVLLAPSRGEGKNMPALEFLSTGGTVIATNWGGHTQWLHPDYAYALDYTLKPIPKYPNTLNASASLEHMKALMLHAFHNREEVKRKGEIGSAVIPQLSSWDSVVSRLFEKIGESSPKGEEVMWKFRTARSAASG